MATPGGKTNVERLTEAGLLHPHQASSYGDPRFGLTLSPDEEDQINNLSQDEVEGLIRTLDKMGRDRTGAPIARKLVTSNFI